MSRLGRDAMTVAAVQALTIASAMGTQSALAWLLGPYDRGAFAICITIAAVLGVLFVPGTDRAAQMLHITGKVSASAAVSAAMIFTATAALLGIAVGAIGTSLGWEIFQKAAAADVLLALITILPATLCSVALELQLAAKREYGCMAAIVALQALICLVGVLVLVWWLDQGVRGALLAYAAAAVLTCIIYWRTLSARHGVRFVRVERTELRQILDYGWRYYGARIGHQLDLNFGLLVLGMIAAPQEIGIFAATSALIMRVLMVATVTDTVMLPRLAADPGAAAEQTQRACRVAGLLTLLLIIPLVLVPGWLIALLFSPQFERGAQVIWCLAPGVLLLGATNSLTGYFRVSNRPEVCSLAVWCGLVTNVALTVVLYPRFNLLGAAIAMSVGLTVRAAVLLVSFVKATQLPVLGILVPRLEDVRSILTAVRGLVSVRERTPRVASP